MTLACVITQGGGGVSDLSRNHCYKNSESNEVDKKGSDLLFVNIILPADI